MHSQAPQQGGGVTAEFVAPKTPSTVASHTHREGCPEETRKPRLGLLIAHCKVLSPRAAGPTAGPYLASLSYRREV